MLGRDTKWRQGMVISLADAQALQLISTDGQNQYAIIITHDCDLANDDETLLEVILAQRVEKPDPMLIDARNPRRLHLCYRNDNQNTQDTLSVELRHAQRKQIEKTSFAKLTYPSSEWILPDDEKRSLKQWLAARYGRPAFPNAFERHLRKEIQKKSIEKHIAKILSPHGKHILGLFLNFEEGRSVELEAGEPYVLSILLVYDASEGGEAARIVAERCATSLQNIFEQAYGKPEHATEIALEKCSAVADTMITLADVRKLDHWRLEYVSLNQDPVDDFFGVGATPI